MDGSRLLDQEIRRLFRVRKTLHEMLIDRGYIVVSDDLKMTLEEFSQRFHDAGFARESLTLLKQKRDDPADQIYVFFSQGTEGPKVSVKSLKDTIARMERDGVHRAIMIMSEGLTPSAADAISKLDRYRIEPFLENELLVNITHHVLVPKHEMLSKAEKKALLKRYKLKESQLPRVQQRDPVSRYYGLSPGDVVRITRPSETAGRYVTYRLVV
mmetsp:Transcript_5444/g.23142  ORF Transcript_5444/g.23142 Transcript_5444/m.23142 type:complete len:213 (-) Transcript_5444:772-1410(-)|eukprot:CAMPEP_0113969840 /NCGR_PEP_ID=MMETSP0011_2-20120614/10630_1 /TAXON_ID=101924 /ORGANISM="Rhodosorus marinus" /LENGTH=212 /DNA_ID=CAMNT_0000983721 /DNA_START=48 /DNA_END=686 /DNA_ORIENTATION=- /assembly_acc=CAM_ASM_000156